jgi:hypothetical protein
MASAFSSEKVWYQDILDDSDIGNVDGLKGLWILLPSLCKEDQYEIPFQGIKME